MKKQSWWAKYKEGRNAKRSARLCARDIHSVVSWDGTAYGRNGYFNGTEEFVWACGVCDFVHDPLSSIRTARAREKEIALCLEALRAQNL